jgi:hypothetical protein
MTKDNSFLRVKLSDMPGDIEVIGGREEDIRVFSIIAEAKGLTVNRITEEQAKAHLLKDSYVSPGVFILNENDVVVDEDRRAKAFDLLFYVSKRIGFSFVNEPIELRV